jgi:hypothetical protein
MEAGINRATLPKTTIGMKKWTRIVFWNVQTMMEASRLSQVIKEMTEYRLDLLGLSETGWRGSGEFITLTGELLIYSGHIYEEKHEYGVRLILSKVMRISLIEWKAVSERIITARLSTHMRKLTIVQCYAPTNVAPIEQKEHFMACWKQLCST